MGVMEKGGYRIWDGKTNKIGSVDALGRPNSVNNEWKYVDPSCGEYNLRITIYKDNQEMEVIAKFHPLLKWIFVYDQSDTIADDDMTITETYASGGLAYQYYGFLSSTTGKVIKSRFFDIKDPHSGYAHIYEYKDEPGLTFGKIYQRLTAGGEFGSLFFTVIQLMFFNFLEISASI